MSDIQQRQSQIPAGAKQRFRRAILMLHLTVGLTVGALLTLTAVTGSLLVFYVEIDRLLTPELVVPASDRTATLDEVVQSLRKAHPQRTGGWRLELPHGPDHPIMARYMKPAEKTGKSFAPLLVAVNPHSAEILSARFWGETAVTWTYDLHYTLLAGDDGRLALTIASIASLVLLGSGAYLWWPATGRWMRALRPKLRSGAVRKVFDLHVLGGVYGGIVLVPLIVTGVILEQPDWFKPAVERLSAISAAPDLSKGGGASLTADQALDVALSHYPQALARWVEVPAQAGGVYHIRLFQPSEPGWRFPKTSVWVNGADGVVLAERDAVRWSFGDAFFGWQHPLHNGESFGLAGRVLAAIGGIIPPLLLVTGFIRWRQKKRTRQEAAL